jgi:regulator of PEP synthase PpsR (kinase-PPPase family)
MSQPIIYVISGGEGASGEQIVRTALVQFAPTGAEVVIVPHVRNAQDLEATVRQAASTPRSTILHTLVDGDLRQQLIRLARDHQVEAIDLMGHLLTRLSAVLNREPIGQPGLYHKLRESYFERVDAIEFTVSHDDGRNIGDLHRAEIVLIGVSRTGKTPLSIYLSTQGWKVANVPIVLGIDPPAELYAIHPSRVIALTIQPGQLVAYRRWRQRRLGLSDAARAEGYADAASIYEEIKGLETIATQGHFALLDITDKPIEESAQEVISLIQRRAKTAEP